jgi:multisubunit Na+/H+ antiporter MnhF subunit
MIEWIQHICVLLLVGSMICGFIRLFKGPDSLNRIIAFDLLAICVIAIVILFSSIEDSIYYIEMILIFCLLGFATTIGITEILYRNRFEKETSDD